VIDMIKATKEFAVDQGIDFDSRLFLAGYSQGGLCDNGRTQGHRTKWTDRFNLVASFPASGGYDVKAMQEYFLV